MNILDKISNKIEISKKGIQNFFSFLVKNRLFRNYIILNLTNNIFVWVFTSGINQQVDASQIILHYNISFGVNLIGNVGQLYFLPIFGLMIIITNLLLAYLFQKNNKLIAHLLFLGSLVFNSLLILTTFSLYLINFR